MQTALALLGGKVRTYDEAKAVLKDAHAWDSVTPSQRKGYSRPQCFYNWQHDIADSCQINKITFVEGSRRVGKSNAAFIGVIENILNGHLNVDLYGAKKDSASRILRDLRNDVISKAEVDPIIVDTTAMRITFTNGGVINAEASTQSSSKGYKTNTIWLEEFDQLLKLQPQVIADAIGILLSEPDMHLVITANKGTGAYKVFEDMLTNSAFKDDVRFFSINDDQAPHITRSGNVELVSAFMQATMGKDYANQQVHNIDSFEGEVFNATNVITSFNSYVDWMLAAGFIMPDENRTRKRGQYTVIAIDPGQGHATGIFIGSLWNGHVFEEESHEFVGKQLPSSKKHREPKSSQQQVTEDYLKSWVAGKAAEYNADIVCESNSGGAWWMQQWAETPGVRHVATSNFGKDATRVDRNSYIHDLSQLINEGRFHFSNDQLRSQLISYNPDDRETVEWSNKGDMADACLHCVRALLRKDIAIAGSNKKTIWDGT